MALDLDEIDRLTMEAYDLVGARYHESYKDELSGKRYDRDLLDRLAEHFDSESIVCDAGCGPSGHIGRYLRDRGIHVVGVDISKECVAIASDHNVGMEFHCMRMTELAFDAASINGIIAYHSIIHTPKRYVGRIFREFQRVLKRGGLLLVAVKEGDEEKLVDDFLKSSAPIWFTYLREHELENYLISSGFRILFIDVRQPYADEIQVARIYVIAERT